MSLKDFSRQMMKEKQKHEAPITMIKRESKHEALITFNKRESERESNWVF